MEGVPQLTFGWLEAYPRVVVGVCRVQICAKNALERRKSEQSKEITNGTPREMGSDFRVIFMVEVNKKEIQQ